MTAGFDNADVGAEEEVFTVMAVLKQDVVLHVPSALTKYVVVIVGLITGVIPEITYATPHDEEYQYQFAFDPNEPPEASRVDVEPEQITGGLPEIDAGNADR